MDQRKGNGWRTIALVAIACCALLTFGLYTSHPNHITANVKPTFNATTPVYLPTPANVAATPVTPAIYTAQLPAPAPTLLVSNGTVTNGSPNLTIVQPAQETQVITMVKQAPTPPPNLLLRVVIPETPQPKQEVQVIDERWERLTAEYNARKKEWETMPSPVAVLTKR